ncbi:MAG: flagellar motor switch protein FliN [Pseudomonadota bacterium]|jgi:flagellar motor switch protein FliN/FliY|nr:flagellar motor switch protein FliN [Pseudomonadota bacterium]NLX31512.1 flagellar motor switch protein FliN [Deltaproteobacteria bacterium]HOR31224.1 flagellar motor switch protein FliN [Syntrophales bacterium]HOR32730.1 flagellar motor switch protein FliN [Syntrophales bacterium]HQC24286.1 flagellar motor switch protein FliN [Syntrophales bacterium]
MEQNEVDSLMQEINRESAAAPPGQEGEIGWDDVKDELEQSRQAQPATEVSDPDFNELQKPAAARGGFDLDFILDIPLTLTVELGRCRMLINELLQLGQGSVVELQKIAGEPMDVYVNQRLIARGEVVVVNEKFGVRLTDIISPAERILKLR